jgi:hypothetical protein
MSMRNLSFAASDDRVFSRVCSGMPSGMRSSSVGFWSATGKEKAPRPMEFEFCSLPCRAFNQPRIYVFMFCIVCFGGDESPEPLQW